MGKLTSRERLEKEIETTIVDRFPGTVAIKQYRRNWPDRLFLLPGGRCFFVEFKRKGKTPRSGQKLVIKKLRERGFTVYVIDNIKDGHRLVQLELLGIS